MKNDFEMVIDETVVKKDEFMRHLFDGQDSCPVYRILARKQNSLGWFYQIDRTNTWHQCY